MHSQAEEKFAIEPLGERNRTVFGCGVPELDSYFYERASRDVRQKVAAVFVGIPVSAPQSIAGYYALSSQEIDIGDLPQQLTKRIGRYRRIPATLLGRLAVDQAYRGRGLGELLLLDALKRSLEAAKSVASFAVVVDAKNEEAAGFYKKYGFLHLLGRRFFLPMKTIEALFTKR